MTNQATLSEQKQQYAALTGEIADLLLAAESPGDNHERREGTDQRDC